MAPALDQQVIVVTGGASGLGLATARALSARGARLALVDVDADGVERAASSLGGEALGLHADISDAAQVGAALERAAEHFGRIDTVMAGAAVTGWGPVLETGPEVWERTIEINVLGTWRTVHAALPHLLRSQGYLLIVSSGLAATAGPSVSAYAASKAAVESLGRSLRVELAHHGVGVGVAYYSFLDTPMVDAIEKNPAAMRARAAMPRPVRRTNPLEPAVRATVAGIERRSARFAYPGVQRAGLVLRGLTSPRSERALEKAMPEVERLAKEQRAGG
jgi:NAD(P)-dependent dehydrogenase (short-subunit alcohol dehydrogenase family)